MRKAITVLPWALALLYAAIAPFIALQSSEGWGYLILTVFTYPAGIVLNELTQLAHASLFGDPIDLNAATHSGVVAYQVARFVIFVVGGALWYFAVGLVLRWLLRRVVFGRVVQDVNPSP